MLQGLSIVSESVEVINSMGTQIATAAEEQSAVAEQINQNVVSILDGASEVAGSSATARGYSQSLITLSNELDALIARFAVRDVARSIALKADSIWGFISRKDKVRLRMSYEMKSSPVIDQTGQFLP